MLTYRIAPDGTPCSAASHLGLFCLPMSNKKDTKLIWVNLLFYTDGACTWPADFLSSTWVDSVKGDLVFLTTTMTGWSFTVGTVRLTDWECHTTDYLDSHGYLVMK